MSDTQTKNYQNKEELVHKSKKTDVFFYTLAIVAIFVGLYFLPELISATKLSFLAEGSGLNKLLTFVLSVVFGWLCMFPSGGYKQFYQLSKGALVEWRKSVKPDKDTTFKTTMMIFMIVGIFALIILLLDWVFASILKAVL